MMYCPKCGNEVKEGAAFCGKCGTPVGQQPGAEEAASGGAEAVAGALARKKGPHKGIIGGAVAAAVVVVVVAVAVGMNVFGGVAVKGSTEDYTWEELSKISEEIAGAPDGNAAVEVANKYHLTTADGKLDGAQTKAITLSNGTQAAVQIAGFAHDEKSDGGKAGITFIFKDCIGKHDMNSTNTNAGGWEASELRSYLNSEGLALLPADLQREIVSVSKLTNNAGETKSASSVTATSDKLWLFSAVEVFSVLDDLFETQAYVEVQNAEGAKYKLFQDMNTIKLLENPILAKSCDGHPDRWWLRSPNPSGGGFEGLNAGGDFNYSSIADSGYGACPGFCI